MVLYSIWLLTVSLLYTVVFLCLLESAAVVAQKKIEQVAVNGLRMCKSGLRGCMQQIHQLELNGINDDG